MLATTMRELLLNFLSQLFSGIGNFQLRFGVRSVLNARSPKITSAFCCP